MAKASINQIVYLYFKCEECDEGNDGQVGWGEQESFFAGNAREQARKHHEKTGHFVTGQICYSIQYGEEKP